jgi:hypothetical protein
MLTLQVNDAFSLFLLLNTVFPRIWTHPYIHTPWWHSGNLFVCPHTDSNTHTHTRWTCFSSVSLNQFLVALRAHMSYSHLLFFLCTFCFLDPIHRTSGKHGEHGQTRLAATKIDLASTLSTIRDSMFVGITLSTLYGAFRTCQTQPCVLSHDNQSWSCEPLYPCLLARFCWSWAPLGLQFAHELCVFTHMCMHT